ncbi:hypothetical protein CGZ69_00640 [Streptomyces peucetius subsp. caesius ATCC 27952]|nr:hypothetical protein CGZ69_00640 [Streptomyces peucetius subsp. caesius ATCC 27952]
MDGQTARSVEDGQGVEALLDEVRSDLKDHCRGAAASRVLARPVPELGSTADQLGEPLLSARPRP